VIFEAAAGALASELLKAMTSEVGKDAYKRGKALLESLRQRFAGNPKATEVIAKYEQEPRRHDADLRSFLIEAAHSDPDFGRVLESTANQLISSQTMTIGTQNINNETVHGAKTVNTASAGRDLFMGNVTFGKPTNSSQ